jgi:predicted dehydrogenase
MEERELRVGDAGTGSIGAAHARSVPLAGAVLAGLADSSPERADWIDVPARDPMEVAP